MDRRMFYIDGRRQMVTELDGTSREADPDDPELIALDTKIRGYLDADLSGAPADASWLDGWPMFLTAHARDMHGCTHLGPPGDGTAEGAAAAILGAREAYELGAAWAEAEAALPEHSVLDLMRFTDAVPYVAIVKDGENLPCLASANGHSPAAALRALAAKLRQLQP